MSDANNEVEIDTEDARAGSTPKITRYVLGISLVLIIVVFAIMFA